MPENLLFNPLRNDFTVHMYTMHIITRMHTDGAPNLPYTYDILTKCVYYYRYKS